MKIEEALDRYLLNTDEPRPFDGKWHPSSLWLCPRAALLAVQAQPITNPPDGQSRRRMTMGKLLHMLVQDALVAEKGLMVYPEFLVDVPELNIEGHGDVLLVTPEGKRTVVEVKSTGSLKYGPKPEHVKQGMTYAALLERHGAFEEFRGESYGVMRRVIPAGPVDQMILVYLNRSDMKMKECPMPYDPSFYEKLKQRVEHLGVSQRLTVTLGKEQGWFKAYCPYRGSGQCCDDGPSAKQLKQMMEIEEW